MYGIQNEDHFFKLSYLQLANKMNKCVFVSI